MNRPYFRVGPLLLICVSCASPTREPQMNELVPIVVSASKSLEDRYRFGVDARLKAGLGFGYFASILENGKIIRFGSGNRTLEPIRKLGERDLLEIGSVSKTFTGILIHFAELEGKLRLDQKLEDFFPELRGVETGGITIRELGLHQAGLSSFPAGISVVNESDPWHGLKKNEVLQALAKFKRTPLPEGATLRERNYSNWGYLVLGIILEQVYQDSIPDLLEERIFSPLHMRDSGVDEKKRITSRRKRRGGRAVRMSEKISPGFSLDGTSVPAWSFSGFAAATGGIESNAVDMARFLEALAAPPRGKLGDAIRATFTSGIGWDSLPGVETPLWKNGMTGGYSSYLAFYPKSKAGVFIATNTAIAPDDLADFVTGVTPVDRLLVRSTVARTPNEAEFKRLKGKFFNRVPQKNPELSLKSLEITEILGRIVGRFDFGVTRSGVLLVPGRKVDEWNIVDGSVNTDTLEVSRDEVEVTVTTSSARTVKFELKKLSTELETFPALEE